MNWKIIVGGLLILAGITQFLKIFTQYRNTTTLPIPIGLGSLFIAMIFVGVYLVRQGRMQG